MDLLSEEDKVIKECECFQAPKLLLHEIGINVFVWERENPRWLNNLSEVQENL